MGVRDRDRGSIVAGLMMVLFGTGFLLDSFGYWTFNLVYVWPLILIGFGTAVLLGRAQRLEVEEKRSSDLAVAEHRVHIAQELHDIVAHSVSLMTVQIAAARKVLGNRPDEAQKALVAAEETGRKSLNELRRIVGVLRSVDESIEAAGSRQESLDTNDGKSPTPSMREIPHLVDEMKEAGLSVTYETQGMWRQPSPAIQLAAYRIIQEAITNVLRHSPDAGVSVEVDFHEKELIIRVADDGAGRVASPRRGGHGLSGMRERVNSVGGSLEAGPAPGKPGWVVEAVIPISER